MSDRPKRDRRPTRPFEYQLNSVESSNAQIKGSSLQQVPPTTSRKRSESKGTARGGVRSGGRDSSRGRNRSQGLSSLTSKIEERLDEFSEESSSALRRDAVDEIETVANWTEDSDDDFDEEEDQLVEDTSTEGSPGSSELYSERMIPSKPILSRLPTDCDQVIEQWYADPYERVNPNDVTYDQWRFRNLHIGLMNQGFSMVKARQIAMWLMKCNGEYRSFEPLSRRPRSQKSITDARAIPYGARCNGTTPSNEIDEDRKSEADNTSVGRIDTRSSRPTTQKAARDKTNKLAGIYSISTIGVNVSSQTKTGEAEDWSATTLAHEESFEDNADGDGLRSLAEVKDPSGEHQLALLKRGLKIFDMVYGQDGPQAHPEIFEHNYFSRASTIPTLVPKRGLFSQGHYALQEAMLPASDAAFVNEVDKHNFGHSNYLVAGDKSATSFGKVLTEDPQFGLTRFAPAETATKEDLNLYYSQFSRIIKSGQRDIGLLTGATGSESKKIMGSQDNLHRQDTIKEQNKKNAAEVVEQLNQRLFGWETSFTMKGGAPRLTKDDAMQEGAFALNEEHVWKEIRQRQEILDDGGEEAIRLLEKEWQDIQDEARRQERRKQTMRSRAKKRAAQDPNLVSNFGKRAKISSWTSDE